MKETDLKIQTIDAEQEDQDTNSAPYKINAYGVDFTIEILSKKLDDHEIIVPSFQRKYVWDQKRASQLIESMLLGLPVPQIFLYREREKQDLLVIDGQQRLRSINAYLRGTFDDGKPFALKSVLGQWEGKSYKTLSEEDRRRLKNYVLRATIFEQVDPTDDSSIYEIFERLNTGGMSLNQQEIRNCVIRGDINQFMDELNRDLSWRKLIGRQKIDSRMKDVEMILRFLSLNFGWETYKRPMKDYLNEFMSANEKMSEPQKNDWGATFRNVTEKLYSEIGADVFRLTSGINVAVLDSVMVGLAHVGADRVSDISKKIERLKKDQTYLDYVSKHTTDRDAVLGRIKLAIQFLSQ